MDKWTAEKINTAINETRVNGIIYFDTYINTQVELENLDDCLFKKRNDLILHFETQNKNNLITLSSTKNIKKIKTNNYDPLQGIENMKHLLYLDICNENKKYLDACFLEGLNELHELYFRGKFTNIEMIGKCLNLEKLYLSTTINNYDFIQSLDKIKDITIDTCQSPCDFALLNKQTLEVLSILSISKLDNIDTIKNFSNLKKLRLTASKIVKLPEMNNLSNLHDLNLSLMKVLENPEMIKTIPSLEKLKLEEINIKLDAERFYFLTEIETLKEIDFRFIDFNKKRIDKLNKWFIKNGKENIVKK